MERAAGSQQVTQLILQKAYDRVRHLLRVEMLVPNGVRPEHAEFGPQRRRVEEDFIRRMRQDGYDYLGGPMRLVDLRPHYDPLGLPKRPASRRFTPGQPRPNREAEARHGLNLVMDAVPLREADGWSYILEGAFARTPLLAEVD